MPAASSDVWNARPRALDQGLDRGSLAAVRTLHDDGWSVAVGSPFRGLSGASRLAERWHRVPAAEGGVGDYIDAVAGAVAPPNLGLLPLLNTCPRVWLWPREELNYRSAVRR